MTDSYQFGIEEEYFLVDAETKAVAITRPEHFLTALKSALGNQVTSEMLQGQIEVMTMPHVDAAAATAELRYLRQTVAKIAAEFGLGILASGTHPTGDWRKAQPSPGARYDAIMDDLQQIGLRDLLCGLHVHVELPEAADRVDVMTRMIPYLPLFLALSTSSPFWDSRRTGLKGYRLAAYDELPRTGVPELFRTTEEFDAYIAALTRAGVIEDSSYIWWAMRPSLKHPTLELRAPDSCTFVDDSVAIASLYRSLARLLVHNPLLNVDLTAVDRALVVENKWRAQRYGVSGTFVAPDAHKGISVAEMLEHVLEAILPHAEALGCAAQVRRCRAIVGGGTSADAQLAVYAAHESREGDTRALAAVNDWIAAATLQ
jgi:glutamate---cysteine ligase / carboxylate-amine ligase